VHVTATKVASCRGPVASAGSTVAYVIQLHNDGTTDQADNSGDELVDVLPAELRVTGATASSGTATVTASANRVSWNGTIAAGGSVSITITARINPGTGGRSFSNQASVSYDADGDGVNETTVPSDDPALPGTTDPTSLRRGQRCDGPP
jgi:uncharacterized repeat protein (TIGR01451 family)